MDEFEKDIEMKEFENSDFSDIEQETEVENTKEKPPKKKKRKLKKFAKYGLVFILICIVGSFDAYIDQLGSQSRLAVVQKANTL